ncbi:MAG: DEAD/DEAH box helicase [Oscillospiraceae bacterium]|nr:DEAD/DEAH box helicase [Oscillospiraceae bacterium]
MLPSILARQLQTGIGDYIEATFPMTNEPFRGSMNKFINTKDALYHEPYFTVRMPFRTYEGENNFFEAIHSKYSPYVHQAKAFQRLTGNDGVSTLIATGTGSGKTECFLYPILEYCYQHRTEPGIKALIIYPMNALASDQAKRIAELIYNSPELKGNVTAGMYVGGRSKNANVVMAEDGIITDKDTMLNNPPDILLTNYKMLDYLLVRPKDVQLWRNNKSETLKYIAVDELHTFDGAQGTDLACLLRRLKNRLGIQGGHLCCVGTSATMGSKENARNILKYASEIFGEPFDEETAIVTEDRLSYSEFLDGVSVLEFNVPDRADIAAMQKAIEEDSAEEYIRIAAKAWFPDFSEDLFTDIGKIKLATRLPEHTFFQSLISVINGNFCQSEFITQELKSSYTELNEITQSESDILIESMLALVSWARTGSEGKLRPFLNVHVQLWMKELRRFLGKVSSDEVTYSIESDLNKGQIRQYLPVLNCRDCGSTGWVSHLNERHSVMLPDIRAFYNMFFQFEDGVAAMFPYENDSEVVKYAARAKLCARCLHVKFDDEATECDDCGCEDLISVQIPKLSTSGKNKGSRQYVCPICNSKRGIALVGLRSATEISTSISQMFSSKFNDDKKTLTFSDNVQDAAHRAGFFNSRTWKFGVRGAIQKCIAEGGNNKNLNDFSQFFIKYCHEKYDDEEFVSFFTPPNMTWMRSYENMVKNRKITYDKEYRTFVYRIEKRLAYEVMLEYGLSGKIGRTLEKSGCSVLGFDTELIEKVSSSVFERLVNELAIDNISSDEVRKMVIGVLNIMKNNGSFDDEAFYGYTKNNFNDHLLSNQHNLWMPGIKGGGNIPKFSFRNNTSNSKTYNLESVNSNTVINWIFGCCKNVILNESIPDIIFDELIRYDAVKKLPAEGIEVYGINKEKTYITSDVSFLKCSNCGSKHTVPAQMADDWTYAPCINGCCGMMVKDNERKTDYYGKLYSTGDLARINAREHTGLLLRGDREELEKDFKRSRDDQKLYDPNVLSCTPTLEMGIDIGDLSSVILCSIPPSQANYAQRVGRAGRKDGNALTLAIANAKPHDLYFYQDPLDMISGEVVPPQIFLKASAVLERQFVAYCMDSWVKNGVADTAVPKKMEICINKLESRSVDVFPYNFMEYVKNNLNSRLNSFMQMFAESFNGDTTVKQELSDFAKGNGLDDSPMYMRILAAFKQVREERDSVQKNINLLQAMIKELEDKPKDSSYDEEIKELRWEESALIGVVKAINSRNVFNFLSDEGLLPNYAFPEEGIKLKAVLKRKEEDSEDSSAKTKYEKMIYEYGRSASAAISEFAPNNSFYVDGRKLIIDQVDIATSKPVKWRLCPNCSHAEEDITGVHTACCPKCGTPSWADGGQSRSMIKVQMVYSNMDYSRSQINDGSEDRVNIFFCRQLLVDVDEENDITSAFEMNNKEFPFGYEFVKKATLRDINFGEKDLVGEKLMVSGIEGIRKGFRICKFCGKIQNSAKNPQHSFTCKAKKDTFSGEPFEDCLFLYREFSTEILRLLIPATTIDASNVKTESFVAAFMLGMREYFGNVSHLHATISEVPVANADYRKQYLVIYDSVPGGTGYLKQLLQNEKSLVEIFQKALAVMENCSCRNDDTKDGCYHCLYAYSQSNSIGNISKNTAIRLLKSILSGRDNIKKIKKLGNIVTNSLFDSELERKFIECLPLLSTDKRSVTVSQTLVNGKEGYLMKINDTTWEIEPQVLLGAADGVSVECKPDFIVKPLFETSRKPVAVFTDGFSFHKEIVADDTLKREAIRRSGKYIVWTLSFKDVQMLFQSQGDYFSETLDYNSMPGGMSMYQKYLKNKGVDVIPFSKMSNAELLMQYLTVEEADKIFTYHAEAYMWSLIDMGLIKRINENEVWKKRIVEYNKILFGNEKGFDAGGIWAARDVNVHLVVYSGIDRNMKDRAVFAVLNDLDSDRTDKYEPEWNGMWRFCNIMQFLNEFMCVSQKGLIDCTYSVLSRESLHTPDVKSNVTLSEDTENIWNDVFEELAYSDDSAIAVVKYAQENNYEKPVIGFEPVDGSGRVIGTIEVAWPDSMVGFIVEDQEEHKDDFVSVGWTIISEKEELKEVLGGGKN